jgi:hypothetical protein
MKQHSKIDLDRLYEDWIFGSESTQLIFDKVPLEKIIQRYIPKSF